MPPYRLPKKLTMYGDVGSYAGAITGFGTFNGDSYAPGGGPAPVNNTLATFSIYRNGTFIINSSRTTDINTSVIALQGMATVASGETIAIRWWMPARLQSAAGSFRSLRLIKRIRSRGYNFK